MYGLIQKRFEYAPYIEIFCCDRPFCRTIRSEQIPTLRWEPVPRAVGGTGCPKSKFFAKTIFEDLRFCVFGTVCYILSEYEHVLVSISARPGAHLNLSSLIEFNYYLIS